LLDDVRQRRIDMVLVWNIDRMSRSVGDLLELVETLREHGVEFAAVAGQSSRAADSSGEGHG